MEKSLVTVVIPVYNVEKYLDRCLESVVHQTYSHLQIILVDDGSPDSCPGKCDRWAEKDSRIQVVHKANAGLGMARNTGIDHAAGDYICFFDSDDYVDPDTVEQAVALAEAHRADTVLFGMTEVDSTGGVRGVYCPYPEKSCYEGSEILSFVLPNMIRGSSRKGHHFGLNMSSCTCLFSMALIREHQWRFVSEREYISEDYYSLLNLYSHVRRVAVLKQACYFYCYNGASLTHVYRADRFDRVCRCYEAMDRMSEQLGYPEDIRRGLAAQYLGNVIGSMKIAAADPDSTFRVKRLRLKAMVQDKTLREALDRIDLSAEPTGRKVLILTIRTGSALLVYLQLLAKLRLSRP